MVSLAMDEKTSNVLDLLDEARHFLAKSLKDSEFLLARLARSDKSDHHRCLVSLFPVLSFEQTEKAFLQALCGGHLANASLFVSNFPHGHFRTENVQRYAFSVLLTGQWVSGETLLAPPSPPDADIGMLAGFLLEHDLVDPACWAKEQAFFNLDPSFDDPGTRGLREIAAAIEARKMDKTLPPALSKATPGGHRL